MAQKPYRRVILIYIDIYPFVASYFERSLPLYIEIYRVAIIEELSIRRRIRPFLISWGQKTRFRQGLVVLSQKYEFWFSITYIHMNVMLYLSYCKTTIVETVSIASKWVNTDHIKTRFN